MGNFAKFWLGLIVMFGVILQISCSSSSNLRSREQITIRYWSSAPDLTGVLVGPVPLPDKMRRSIEIVMRQKFGENTNVSMRAAAYGILSPLLSRVIKYINKNFGETIVLDNKGKLLKIKNRDVFVLLSFWNEPDELINGVSVYGLAIFLNIK